VVDDFFWQGFVLPVNDDMLSNNCLSLRQFAATAIAAAIAS
jgi:hypothetical protein